MLLGLSTQRSTLFHWSGLMLWKDKFSISNTCCSYHGRSTLPLVNKLKFAMDRRVRDQYAYVKVNSADYEDGKSGDSNHITTEIDGTLASSQPTTEIDGTLASSQPTRGEQSDESGGEPDKTADNKDDLADELIISYDDALDMVGPGRYQAFLYTILALSSVSTAFHNMGMVWLGAEVPFECDISHLNHTSGGNSSNFTTMTPMANRTTFEAGQCDYTEYFSNDLNFTVLVKKHECSKWKYDLETLFKSTIVADFDLVCTRSWMNPMAQTIFMFGYFCGSIILGDLSERFGRKTLIVASALIQIVSGVAASFSPNYSVFVILRYFLGIGTAGLRNSGFVLLCEISNLKWRSYMCLFAEMTWAIGYILLGGISAMILDWRQTQLVTAVAMVWYLLYWSFSPESPRWLLTKGRHEEAKAYFENSARINRIPMPKNYRIAISTSTSKTHSIVDMVRTPNVRGLTIFTCFLWFLVSAVYFAMSYNVGNLGGNIFVSNTILGGVEIIGAFVSMGVVLLGRSFALFASFALGSIASFLIMAVPEGSNYVIDPVLALATVGKFATTSTFGFIYIHTAEVYPTVIRNLALGLGSSFARLGAMVSPYLAYSDRVWNKLPYLIFGVCGGVAAVISLFMPETLGSRLPDTMEDVESTYKMGIPRRLWAYQRKQSSSQDEKLS